jgi:glucose/arabinose dehydrogenase
MGGAGGSAAPDAAVPADVPVADAGPLPGKCDFVAKPNATQVTLRFEELQLEGVPTADAAKPSGLRDGIVEVKFIPGTADELLLVQKRGRISHMRLAPGGASATLIGTINLLGVDVTQDCGLLSLAFDPGFASNKLLYLGLCHGPKATKITRYTWDKGGPLADPVDIMTWTGSSGNSWHSMGSIGFDAQGNLWAFHGDFTHTAMAQSLDTNLGKLLRVVPSRTPGQGGYEPAPGNPWATEAKPRSAIYAVGFRSPWRGFINARGQYFVGDVGDTTNEEVNLVTQPGQNFGWGTCPGVCTPALTAWRPQEPYDGEGNLVKEARRGRTVWAGTQYGDCGNDRYGGALTGVHIFGDFFAGWFRGMVLDDAGAKVKDANLGDLSGVSSVTQGPDGYLYATTVGPYDSATTERPALFRVVRP